MKKIWERAVAFGLLFAVYVSIDAMALEGSWQKTVSGWEYLQADGTLIKENWAEINGYHYYFDRSGSMLTGWVTLSGKLYCFRNSGELFEGWCQNPNSQKWYYYNKDGSLHQGWIYDRGSWYWLDSNGTMLEAGSRNIDGEQYVFFNTGQMAANQYVGTYYIDENGHRDKNYDIIIVGKYSPTAEDKDRITDAMKDVPKEWMKHFISQGWRIMYYPKKSFFSAPETDLGIYYTYHTLDRSYKKLKFITPEALTRGMGEYIGYASGLYRDSDVRMAILRSEQIAVEELCELPDYYDDNDAFYFGILCELYWNPDMTERLQENAPELYQILKQILEVP